MHFRLNPAEIDKKKFERERILTFLDPSGSQNKFNTAGLNGLLLFIMKSKIQDTLPRIIIMLRILLTILELNMKSKLQDTLPRIIIKVRILQLP